MTKRLGRWQQVIIDALDQQEMIGLQVLLEHHLGRRPARAESIAAQRAARLLAAVGLVNLAHIPLSQFRGRHAIRLLVVTRSDVNPSVVSEEALRLAETGSIHAVDRTDKVLAEIVAAVTQAAGHVDGVNVLSVDAETADRSAQALALSLRRLTRLRQSLLTGGRSTTIRRTPVRI